MALLLSTRSQFEQIKLLGRGSFGQVHLVKDLASGSHFAVKEIDLDEIQQNADGEKNEQLAEMVKEEGAKMANLQHQNFIKVLGCFTELVLDRQFCHLVMEYCTSGTLEEAIREGKQFEEIQIRLWTKQIASALVFLHKNGILHRDIKTENIFLFENRKTAKLSDLGTGKEIERSASPSKSIADFRYCPPEFLEGHAYSKAADVWAFGVVLCRITRLEFPFVSDSEDAFKISLLIELPIEIPDYNSKLNDFINSALTVDSTERPTADQLLGSAFLVTADRPKSIIPPPPPANNESDWIVNDNAELLSRKDASTLAKLLVSENSSGLAIIHEAAANGSIKCLEFALTKMPSLLNKIDKTEQQWTPLHHAADGGHFVIVDFLLQKGADVLAKSSHHDGRNTAIHLAAFRGHLAIVKLLVSRHPFLKRIVDTNGNLPIHKAALGNQLQVIDYLITQQGIKVNVRDEGKCRRTCLHKAAINGHVDLVQWLVKSKGANVYKKTSKEDREDLPIHLAAFYGHLPVVEFFIENYPELITASNANGSLPIHKASLGGQIEVVAFFLDLGVDIHVVDRFQRTCLHHAANKGHADLAEWLIEQGGANPFAQASQEDDQVLPIHLAAYFGHFALVKFLVEKFPALKTATDGRGNHPIHKAALGGHIKVVEYFIARGVDVNLQDEGPFKRTCLHRAAKEGHLELVKWLVKNGANVKAKSSREDFEALPIHHAAHLGHLAVVKFFIEQFPDLETAANSEGCYPIHTACLKDQVQVVDYFIRLGLDVNIRDASKYKRTCLHHAASDGHLELVQWLVRRGAGIYKRSSPDDHLSLPVHLAAYFGHLAVVQFFVQNYPDLFTVKAQDGKTPLQVAKSSTENGAQAVAKWLKSGKKKSAVIRSLLCTRKN